MGKDAGDEPHVRAPQPKPGLVIPFLACASLVVGLQWATHHAATVVTGPTKADVLSGMLAVEDGANDVDLLRRDTLSEDVANADAQYKALDSRQMCTFILL